MIQFFIDTTLKLLQGALLQILGVMLAGVVVALVLSAVRPRRGVIAYIIRYEWQSDSPYHQIVWRIWNAGNRVVYPKRYKTRPIKFIFGKNALVERAEIVEAKPVPTTQLALTRNGNNVELAPVFLEKGDSITLEFLVKDFHSGSAKLLLEVVGHKTIDALQESKKLSGRASIYFKLLFVTLVAWVVAFIVHTKQPQMPVLYYVSLGLAFFITFLGTLSIICRIFSAGLSNQQRQVNRVLKNLLRPRGVLTPSSFERLVPVRPPFGGGQRPRVPQRPPAALSWILRVLSKSSVFAAYMLFALIFLSGSAALAYVHVHSCSLVSDKSVNVAGSTAFAPFVQDVAAQYQQSCPGANVRVNTGALAQGSLNGLQQVENGTADIAISDIFADPYQNKDLQDYQAAVVVFALVASDSVHVTNLTTEQVREIYSGYTVNWSDVGNDSSLNIVLISRPSTSSTRLNFEKYVLGGIETIEGPEFLLSDTDDTVASFVKTQPGAIGYVPLYYANKYHLKTLSIDGKNPQDAAVVRSGAYTFWNIEHAYTKGAPAGPTKDFLAYMFSNAAKPFISKDAYLDPASFSQKVLIDHISQI